jgi:Zn finger protein HypA/HybF involved in hydrogenase expression
MHVLHRIKKLDDCFGMFNVHVKCRACGSWREMTPKALAVIVGWTTELKSLESRMRCSKCQAKDAEVVAVAEPKPRSR